MFSMLRASNYQYDKEPLIVENLKILTIQQAFFSFIFLQSISLWGEIDIFHLFKKITKNGHNVPLYIKIQ